MSEEPSKAAATRAREDVQRSLLRKMTARFERTIPRKSQFTAAVGYAMCCFGHLQ